MQVAAQKQHKTRDVPLLSGHVRHGLLQRAAYMRQLDRQRFQVQISPTVSRASVRHVKEKNCLRGHRL